MCITSLTLRTYEFFYLCIYAILVGLETNSDYFSKRQRLIFFLMQKLFVSCEPTHNRLAVLLSKLIVKAEFNSLFERHIWISTRIARLIIKLLLFY